MFLAATMRGSLPSLVSSLHDALMLVDDDEDDDASVFSADWRA